MSKGGSHMQTRLQSLRETLFHDDAFRDLDALKVRNLIAIGLAEVFGVSFFIFLGCGNLVKGMKATDDAHINTVLAFALGIATSIIVFLPISGSLLNPVLNVTSALLGHMSLIKLVYYTICQLLGSLLGITIVRLCIPTTVPERFCVPCPTNEVDLIISFLIEYISTSILTFGFCSVVDKRVFPGMNHLIAIKFALIIIAIGLPVSKWTGCSMNPARILGPAVLANYWEHHWIYWVAPYSASISVTILYRLLFEVWEAEEEKTEAA